MKYITFVAILFLSTIAFTQSAHQHLKSADSEYLSRDYTKAEENYRKALEVENSAQANYNLGNSIFQQKRYDEAIKHYNNAIQSATDPSAKSAAFYNLGNTHFFKEEYDKSVEAYKNSLRLKPDDDDAKLNLSQAQRLLRMQQQQQEQQQQQNEDSEQDENQDQEQQESEQQNDENPSEEQEEQQQNESNEQQEESEGEEKNAEPAEPQDLSKEDAAQLLKIMDEEERKVQEKIRKKDVKPAKSDKDW